MEWPRRKPQPANRPAITAAATPVPQDRVTGRWQLRKRESWQEDAFDYLDTVPELSYATTYVENAFGKIRLVPAVIVDQDEDPVPIDAPESPLTAEEQATVRAELGRLRSLSGGQSRIVARLGAQLFLPGECYLVGRAAPTPTGTPGEVQPSAAQVETWDVLSIDELVEKSGKLSEAGANPDGSDRPLPDGTLVIRVHQEHLRRRDRPTSSVKAVLDALEELSILNRVMRATGKSRIAQSAIVGVPDELDLPPSDPDEEHVPLATRLLEHFITPIGDEGSASAAAPFLITGKADALKAMKDSVITIDRPFDAVMAEQRLELRTTIATGLDLPAEILTGVKDVNHWCVSDDTEILTRARGWIRQDQLAVGDVVRTLNHDSGLAEWQPVLDIYRAGVVDEPMRELRSRTHSSMSTLNHRWPVLRNGRREWLTSSTLGTSAHVLGAAPSGDLPEAAKYDDTLVELVGWFWTEGNLQPGGAATIAQSHTVNAGRVGSIRRALTALYGPPSTPMRNLPRPAWRESVQQNTGSHGGPVTVFHLNKAASEPLRDAAPGKILSAAFVDALTLAQLHLLIDTSCQGDGWHYRSGILDIWQKNPAALDAFERALHLAGYATSTLPAADGWAVRAMRTVTSRPVKAAQESTRTCSAGATDQVVPYTGVLWCPVTPNGTWLARRHGRSYFTGNTAWAVDEQKFKDHLEPRVITVCDALTVGWLRVALTLPKAQGGHGWAPERAAIVVLWFDATRLISTGDPTKDADDAFDRGALSWDAYRRYKGYEPTDEPTIEELRLRQELGISKGRQPTQGTPVPPGDTQPADDPGPPPGESPPPVAPPVKAALTAATPAHRGRALSRRLLDVDRDLRARVETECDLALRAALLKAGNRTAKAVQASGSQEAKRVVAQAPRGQLTATLGRAIVAQLGVTDDELLAGTVADLLPRWTRLVATAQKAVLTELAAALKQPATTPALAGLAARQVERRDAAWQVLQQGLLEQAKTRLYDPAPDAADVELDVEAASVPTTLIRRALTLAGGGAVGATADVQTAQVELRGGIGLGADVYDVIDAHGGRVDGYEWVYGVSSNGFPPHEALTGVQFDTFDDDQLRNIGDFPDEPYLSPGDHDGCACDAMPLWALQEDPERFYPHSGSEGISAPGEAA